jgi:hypothetical protein
MDLTLRPFGLAIVYHIYIVLDIRPLELITDLTKISAEPSK